MKSQPAKHWTSLFKPVHLNQTIAEKMTQPERMTHRREDRTEGVRKGREGEQDEPMGDRGGQGVR